MKRILHVYFIISLCLGTVVYFATKYHIELPRVVRFYLNDFLIIPIVLSVSLWVLRWSKNDKNYVIPIWIILYMCALYAILYEFILPKTYLRYTADFIDVVLYFVSGVIFYNLQKKTVNKI